MQCRSDCLRESCQLLQVRNAEALHALSSLLLVLFTVLLDAITVYCHGVYITALHHDVSSAGSIHTLQTYASPRTWRAGKLSADQMDDMLNNMRLAAPAADGVLVQLLTRWAAAGRQQTQNSAQPASELTHGAATGKRLDSPPLPGSPSVLEAAERPAKRARRHIPVAPEESVSEEMVCV